MTSKIFFVLPLFLMMACSETNLDDLDTGELEEIEKQVEEEAQSLAEAAAEAVQVLEEDVSSELAEDGIAVSDSNPSTSIEQDEQEQ